ncbi:MAG: HAD-IIB family hydrolase [Verrucomicrobia bacterium]|jgi:HAD superfamily hydrolase (TIGR01484 family)|nr:HAD-IIB family hydrolase [Verrucomicrobiota bacterium]
MNHFNPECSIAPRVLATDLDGTLIPLPETEANRTDLQCLADHFAESQAPLVFATGRHFESVLDAIEQYNLPTPEWVVCDVGSAIYQRVGSGFQVFEKYESHLAETSGGLERTRIEKTLSTLDGLELQSPAHQQRFKISYQSNSDSVVRLVDQVNEQLRTARLPYECMGSVDPFSNCGLLDVMPAGVSKAYALIWLSTHADFSPDEVIYSGDSGNDYAALVSGFRAIVVANGSEGLAEKVRAQLVSRGISDRFYLAVNPATSGVLEGCRHFGLIS